MKIFKSPIPDHIRQAALASFPRKDWDWWHQYGNGKLATVDPSRIPNACVVALNALAIACPPSNGFYDFEFYGAGLHFMPTGTSLALHRDATHHNQKPWKRAASLVYFLEDGDGGELVVEGTKIPVQANMATTFESQKLHEVLTTNKDRKTLALFAWEIDHGEKQNTSAQFIGKQQ